MKQSKQENIAYLVVWGLLFAAPLLSVLTRMAGNEELAFDWREVFVVWRLFAVYLVLFLVHNFLLAPLLVHQRRRIAYFSIVIGIVVAFAFYQCSSHPRMERPMMRHEHPMGPPSFDQAPPQFDKAPPQFDQRRPHRDMHRNRPPRIVGERDIMAVVVLILMFGANLGVKGYFRSRDDRKRLAELEKQNLETVIVFSKNDLDDADRLMNIYGNAGYKVLSISNKTMEGIDKLRDILKGKISVLSGPSGVGKSSLINSLLEQEYAETGELSEKIGRGKNTTRHTELISLGEDTYIMDTPGYSSIEIMCDDADEVSYGFREMRPYLGKCRFTGCSHVAEPDCAVKKAVEDGAVSQERYESYVRIYEAVKVVRKY